MKNIHIYQIIIILVSSFMIFQGLKSFLKREKGQTFYKFSIRLIVWGGMMLIAIFPRLTNVLAEFVGLKGNINAAIITGFILVFLMIFKLLSAIERLEQNISEITRKDALKEIKK